MPQHVKFGAAIGPGLQQVISVEPEDAGKVVGAVAFTEEAVDILDAVAPSRKKDRPLVSCPGDRDGSVFHMPERGRGPAKVNSSAFCAGHERIFGKSGRD